MSSFTTHLLLEVLDDGKFRVAEQFEYHIGSYPSEEIIDVPAGTFTDFASTPWYMHWIFPPTGKYSKAAVVHDFLYRSGVKSRKDADNIFLEAMGTLDVPKWKRNSMFIVVRLFGWVPFNKHHSK